MAGNKGPEDYEDDEEEIDDDSRSRRRRRRRRNKGDDSFSNSHDTGKETAADPFARRYSEAERRVLGSYEQQADRQVREDLRERQDAVQNYAYTSIAAGLVAVVGCIVWLLCGLLLRSPDQPGIGLGARGLFWMVVSFVSGVVALVNGVITWLWFVKSPSRKKRRRR